MKSSSIIHLLLLGYIVAALSFWWLSLEKQSSIIYEKEMATLNSQLDNETASQDYTKESEAIMLRKSKRSKQYLGEGLTFLAVILIGSFIVYTSYRLHNRLQQQQNNFMLSVTHELKSPIAAMKLTLQTLGRHKLSEEKQQALIDKCITEADRLNDLCSNILIASQMEGGIYRQEKMVMSAGTLIKECVDAYRERYPDRITYVAADQARPLYVRSDKVLFQLVLNNLLENAVKYSSSDSDIIVQVSHTYLQLVIAVKDLGPGIPDKEKKKIFEKFYRVGNENMRKTKGTGMGLYLSRKIIQSLHGEIVLKDNVPNGSIFEIVLPLANDEE